jgi:hypothetical protein
VLGAEGYNGGNELVISVKYFNTAGKNIFVDLCSGK